MNRALMTLLLTGLFLGTPGLGQEPTGSTEPSWRTLGPAAFGGRITDLAVHPEDASHFYVATAAGGIFKTTNRGGTFESIFDAVGVMTIGDLALAPSNPKRLYVGTGEANNQRSSYAGAGVFRSDDGGKTFQFLGLRDTQHIGRIAVHPTNPDIVFVAALGALYSPNLDRGLYRSVDGGESFEHVLAIDADTGVVDVLIDPIDPQTVYAASYERRRRAHNFREAGDGSGLWRSRDGGTSWQRLSGGLPEGRLGRIGLALHGGAPGQLFVCVENANEKASPEEVATALAGPESHSEEIPVASTDAREELHEAPGAWVAQVGGEVYASDDGGESFVRRNEKSVGGQPGYYYGQIRVAPTDPNRLFLLGVQLFHSRDGGRKWKNDGARGVHVDHHALWIDPTNADHLLLGNDGGLARSYDGGKTWDVFENLPVAQFYAVAVGPGDPYAIYGGTQDNGTWRIPSRTLHPEGIRDQDAWKVNGGDGFQVAIDPKDPQRIYTESQFGRLVRIDLDTNARRGIRPRNAPGEDPERYNWMSPLLHSQHADSTLYFGTQRLWKTHDAGVTWEAVSEDLTTRDAKKIAGNVPHCTITTIAESPLRADLLYVGTDDGKVWVTRDAGVHWEDLSDRFPSEVQGLWVSRIIASAHEPGRAYVAFTGYREDRFAPYLYVTTDFGGRWQPRDAGLPQAAINSLLEDPLREGLLYVAQENGVQVSTDGGVRYRPLMRGMPPVPVHDLALAEDAHELVAATHGRGLFALDVRALRSFDAESMRQPLALGPARLIETPSSPFANGYGKDVRRFFGENPEPGLHLLVHVGPTDGEGSLTLELRDGHDVRVRRVNIRKPERGVLRRTLALRPSRAGRALGQRPLRPGTYVLIARRGDYEERAVITVPERAALEPSSVSESVEEEAATAGEG